MSSKKRLGELLLEAGVIDETQLQSALGHQRRWGGRLGQALLDLKLTSERAVVEALSLKSGIEVARLSELEPYSLDQAMKLVPREFAVRNNIFPMGADTSTITVAMSDPSNLALADELRFRSGRRVRVCIGGDREIAEAIRFHYQIESAATEAIALDEPTGDGLALAEPFEGGSAEDMRAMLEPNHAAVEVSTGGTAMRWPAEPSVESPRPTFSPAPGTHSTVVPVDPLPAPAPAAHAPAPVVARSSSAAPPTPPQPASQAPSPAPRAAAPPAPSPPVPAPPLAPTPAPRASAATIPAMPAMPTMAAASGRPVAHPVAAAPSAPSPGALATAVAPPRPATAAAPALAGPAAPAPPAAAVRPVAAPVAPSLPAPPAAPPAAGLRSASAPVAPTLPTPASPVRPAAAPSAAGDLLGAFPRGGFRNGPAEEEHVELLTLADEVDAVPVEQLAPEEEKAAPAPSHEPTREAVLLDALGHLASVGADPSGALPPGRLLAVLLRLLVKKKLVTRQELLDELMREPREPERL